MLVGNLHVERTSPMIWCPRSSMHAGLSGFEQFNIRTRWFFGNGNEIVERNGFPPEAQGLMFHFGQNFFLNDAPLGQTHVYLGESPAGSDPESRLSLSMSCESFIEKHLLIFNAYFNSTPLVEPIPFGFEVEEYWHSRDTLRIKLFADLLIQGVGLASWWERPI